MGGNFEETTLENMTVKNSGHIPDEWIVVKRATPEENEIMERRCVSCNKLMDSKDYSFYPEKPKDEINSFLTFLRKKFEKFFEILKNNYNRKIKKSTRLFAVSI